MTEPTPPAADAPRHLAADVLRGVAVLGILPMNVQEFAMPEMAYVDPHVYGDFTGWNRAVWIASYLLCDLKFVSVFALLFGAGSAWAARNRDPADARRHQYRRLAVLLLFGFVHAYLLYSGDILVGYALLGLALTAIRAVEWPVRRLFTVGAALVFLGGLVQLGFVFAGGWGGVEGAAASTWVPSPESIAAEIAGNRGGFAEQFAVRLPRALAWQLGGFAGSTFWRAGGFMLLGLGLARTDGLAVTSVLARPRTFVPLFAGGLALVLTGLPHYLATAPTGLDIVSGATWNWFGSAALALAYTGAVLAFTGSGRLAFLRDRLAATGRLAFTNYLSQSVLGGLVFLGHGLGLFGHVARTGQALFVVVVWALQLAWSAPWLARNELGPVEWVWRSLTARRRLPHRRRIAPSSLENA